MNHSITVKLSKKTSAKVKDPENPAWTENMLGATVVKRRRGPKVAPTKVLTLVRLGQDVLAFFKAQGAGYQSRINAALRTEVKRNLASSARPSARKRAAA